MDCLLLRPVFSCILYMLLLIQIYGILYLVTIGYLFLLNLLQINAHAGLLCIVHVQWNPRTALGSALHGVWERVKGVLISGGIYTYC